MGPLVEHAIIFYQNLRISIFPSPSCSPFVAAAAHSSSRHVTMSTHPADTRACEYRCQKRKRLDRMRRQRLLAPEPERRPLRRRHNNNRSTTTAAGIRVAAAAAGGGGAAQVSATASRKRIRTMAALALTTAFCYSSSGLLLFAAAGAPPPPPPPPPPGALSLRVKVALICFNLNKHVQY